MKKQPLEWIVEFPYRWINLNDKFREFLGGDTEENPVPLWPFLLATFLIFLFSWCLGPNVVGFGLSIIENILWPS